MAYDETMVYATLERIRQRISDNIESKGIRASGKTQASMRIEMREDGGRLVGRPAFWTLEEGRPAGRVPYNFVGIIKQWMIDKGLSYTLVPYVRRPSRRWQPKYTVEERSLNMAAGSIAHSIATRGTLLYRQGGRKDIYSDVIADEVQKLTEKITLQIVETIQQSIK